MFILRFVGLILLLALAICAGAYLFTGQRRYLGYAYTVFKVAIAVALVFFAIFVLERFLVPVL